MIPALQPTPSRLIHLSFFAVGLAGLVWLVHRVGLDTVRAGLGEVGYGFVVACVAHLLAVLCDAITLRACAGAPGDRVAYAVYARASLAGHGINAATPLGKVGELTKFALLGEKMTAERAAAALIVQNFVMFVVGCALIAVAAVVAWLAFDVADAVMAGFWLAAAVFGVLGLGAGALMWRGVGDGPLRLARRLGVSRQRVARWTERWQQVRAAWVEVTASRRRMGIAFLSSAASRFCDIAEAWVICTQLGVPVPAAVAVISAGNYQVVYWMTSFVPMQVGTAEGGAYFVFRALGLTPAAGVLLELVRKIRTAVFVAIAVALLGWHTTRQMMVGRAPRS